MLIPTRSKAKIPQGWSYPVGAEAVSAALSDVPQSENIYLRFLWVNPTSSDAKQHDPSLLHLLGVSYSQPRGMDPQNWHIDVSAIPSPMKDRIRTEFNGPVLETVRDWMMKERDPIWYAASKYLSVEFDLNLETVVYWEANRN